MRFTAVIINLLVLLSFNVLSRESPALQTIKAQANHSKIKVLNFGTFHFGPTPDAHSTEFDEEDKNLQKEVRAISKMIAKFRPTIICVESVPEKNEQLNSLYQQFLKHPSELITSSGETSMIAFDVARLNNVEKIYGIDNHMGYNYSVGDFIENSPELTNSIDPKTYLEITNNPFKHYPELAALDEKYESLSLLEKLKFINHPISLNASINANADKLLYVGLDDNFEGADNAALFYHRNMKIYSNLNRIKMNKNDRVFILMGAAHTAFLREFIKRSPKFEMVDTLEYLKTE
ncbi:DUF5694 domain-containing protein [Thalassotalea sp. 1_MG-2023]|uniref:DUF5694 domain-containing protein n=1 Tax=Thalassotalea sp. 1_MG-2023 TaxID=3062680 RepID=UPI0026E278F7|nr:DUF5694 domain-containing protein [Thalassotalea sp. 1_MG-2023]MDO6426984.1 DUF5694 domain-containing protein [Thalassotalea sp. 1_MG-2023]